jgi:hypothetical protein
MKDVSVLTGLGVDDLKESALLRLQVLHSSYPVTEKQERGQ